MQTGVTQVATPASLSGSPTLAGPVQISQVAVSGADAVIFLQNVFLGGQEAGLRQAPQSGAQVRLVDGRGEAVSQGVVP